MHHEVKFQQNTVTGRWKARCTCGWCWVADKEEVQSRAATHDIEWVDADPTKPDETPLVPA